MTVTITANVSDVTGRSDNTEWRFTSVIREGSQDGHIITTKHRTVTPVGGQLSVELDPGFAIVEFGDNQWMIIVPTDDADLWDLIEVAAGVPPTTGADVIAAALQTYIDENPGFPSVNNLSDATAFMKTMLLTINDQVAARAALGIDLIDLDEWEWFDTRADFPATGVDNVVYGARNSGPNPENTAGALYRWNGATYVLATASVSSVNITDSTAEGRDVLTTSASRYYRRARYVAATNGTDDRAAIQAVLAEGPGVVVFPKGGSWIVDPTGQAGGNMLKPQSNTTIIVEEGATIRVKDNALAGYALFCLDGVENVTIKGAGTLQGDSPTHTGSSGANGHLVLITNGSSNCRVLGPLLLKWSWGDGVYIGGTASCSNILVDGLTIEDCRRQGVGPYWVDGCIVRNCRIFDIGLTDIDYTLCNAAAIDVEPNAAQVVNHVLIENNDVSACRGSGITVLGHFGTVTGVVVRGNRIDGCGYDSSVVIAGVPHGLIVKNVADSPQVIDNTVTNSGYSGGTAVSNLNVRLSNGAVVRGGFYAGASGPGIYVDTCTFATIDGATVDSNTHYGVLLNGSDDTLVNGCDLVDNCQDDAAGTAHLHIFNGDRTVARGNTLRGDLGVAWVITQDATVVDSLFVNNVGVGAAPTSMASDGGTNTVFVGNVRKGTGVYENWTTADKVAAGTVELGHASDTTVARTAAGRAAIEGAEIITSTAAVAADAKATPVDADRFVLFDSADSNEPKQSTWGNIKTTLASWLGLLPSGTAIAIHNQSDQTTNYERLRAFFSSNLAQLMTEQGGSGAFRDLRIGVGGAHYVNFSISNPKVLLSTGGGGVAGAMVQISTGTLTGASVAQTGLKIASTANQSGTSSYTTLEIDITETATGSGAKKPISVKVGGSEKFHVDNAGGVLALGTVDVGHASDTTVSRLSAGQLGVEGNPLGTKVAVPSTASSTGVVGQWAVDASFVYYCTAANTWVRAAVATW